MLINSMKYQFKINKKLLNKNNKIYKKIQSSNKMKKKVMIVVMMKKMIFYNNYKKI